jgi:hypothetical protein
MIEKKIEQIQIKIRILDSEKTREFNVQNQEKTEKIG